MHSTFQPFGKPLHYLEICTKAAFLCAKLNKLLRISFYYYYLHDTAAAAALWSVMLDKAAKMERPHEANVLSLS